MPSQTFFNLPEDKREQIVRVAITEFAEHDYENASISRIVARAGIAKGSFYQYFAHKEDLYGYLLGLLIEAKTRFMSLDHPDPRHVGIFAYLRWTAEVGVAFQLAHPQLSQIGLRAVSTGRFPRTFDNEVRAASTAFYRRLVEVGKQQGDIRPDIDAELAATVFDAVLSGASRLVFELIGHDGLLAAKGDGNVFAGPEVTGLFERTVQILEHGLGRQAECKGGERGQVGTAGVA